MAKLTAAGIDTYALVGPVLDHLEGTEREFVDAVAATGVKRAVIDTLNRRPQLGARLDRMNIRGSEVAREKIRRDFSARGISVSDVF